MTNINDLKYVPNIDLNDEKKNENKTNKAYSRLVGKVRFLGLNDVEFLATLSQINLNDLLDLLVTAKSDNKDTKQLVNDILTLPAPETEETETALEKAIRDNNLDKMVATYSTLKQEKHTENKPDNKPTEVKIITPAKTIQDILTAENIQLG